MAQLRTPAPVNFVLSSDFDPAPALAAVRMNTLIRDNEAFRWAVNTLGDVHWIALTFIYLKRAGFEGIRLSHRVEPGWINVGHSESLRLLPARTDAFVVAVQADFPPRRWAHHRIVQNRYQLGRNATCIYLWPHPGIVPRMQTGGTIERVAYLGQTYNGNLAWDEARWRELLRPLGVEFIAKPPDRWHDFSDVDAAIAIRSFGEARHSNKPPSKLINAWLAGVPFIGGADSAYAQVGRAGVDHLCATTPEEVVAAVAALRDDPARVATLVAHGRERVARFNDDATLRRWVETFEGPIGQRYARWAAAPSRERWRARMLMSTDRAAGGLRRIAGKIAA